MRKIIFIGLMMSMVSCVSIKKVEKKEEKVHFALTDHTFEEVCAYFDSCHRTTHPELYDPLLVRALDK